MENIGLLFKQTEIHLFWGSGKIKSSHKKINYLRNYYSFCGEKKNGKCAETSRAISKVLLLITKVMYSGKILKDGKKFQVVIGSASFFLQHILNTHKLFNLHYLFFNQRSIHPT